MELARQPAHDASDPQLEHAPRDTVAAESAWRRMYIRAQDLDIYGFHPDECEACEAIQQEKPRQGIRHSEACRARIIQAMQATPHGQARLAEAERREQLALTSAGPI